MKTKVKFKEVVTMLAKIKNPLGDLCRDILSDEEFPINNQQKALQMVRFLGNYYCYIEKPAKQLIEIYKTINKR